MSKNVLEQVRKSHPALAKREKTSRAAATRLFCLHCMGGSAAEVSKCTTVECPLWVWRLGRKMTKNDALRHKEK